MAIKSNNKNYHAKLIEHLYNQLPAFSDVFTEELFYMTVVIFVISTILVAFILSRIITIKPAAG